jgi:CubicO group peptidase (beta-lactamase class C family)
MKKIYYLLAFLLFILIQLNSKVFSENRHFRNNNFSYSKLSSIDSIVHDGIKAKAFPGCQVLVIKSGQVIYDKCFGYCTYDSIQEVKSTTLYDLASLTKTTATLMAVMKLYDSKKLKISDKASKYLSFLRNTDKENISIQDLLFHETGLPGSLPFYKLAITQNNNPLRIKTSTTIIPSSTEFKYIDSLVSKYPSAEFALQVSDSFFLHKSIHASAMKMIAETHLNSKTYHYSCINFILLKEIVEIISGMPMDKFLDKKFYSPLQLNNMSFLPLRTHSKLEIAPTLTGDFLRNGVFQGFVHDPAAAFLGGISGNAGLFANATDLAVIYQLLLNNGRWSKKRFLKPETCKLFTTTNSVSGRRGLGFDKPIPADSSLSPCCKSAPYTVYGHTGYTGNCCWVDPTNQLIYIFLSNRTYPEDVGNKLSKMGIRTQIQEVIYQSIKD